MVSMQLPPDIVDLTAKTPQNYRIKNRMSARIDTVVLHQTSFSRGNVPENYLSVHAHYVVMQDGRIVQLHPIEKYLVASSAFNDDAISVEFVGNFPDERGHYWEGKTYGQHTLAQLQIEGGRDLVQYLNEAYTISFLFAHRQGEKENSRGNCPDPDIWYNIGEWAKLNLQMSDGGKGYIEGNGSPIPDSWRKPRD
jgi:N-acetyl-anhydromuramyl-L-alanine amidase AmpD